MFHASMCTAVLALTIAGGDPGPTFLEIPGSRERGILVNHTQNPVIPGQPNVGADPRKPTVVIIHGANPTPDLFRFTLGEDLTRTVARQGGGWNVYSWQWNAGSPCTINLNRHSEVAVAQGQALAAQLLAQGVRPESARLVGCSIGAVIAASAARTMAVTTGVRLADLWLLDPPRFLHDDLFRTLAASSHCARVNHIWCPGPSGFGGNAPYPGVRNAILKGPTPWVGLVWLPKSSHLYAAQWYVSHNGGDPAMPAPQSLNFQYQYIYVHPARP